MNKINFQSFSIKGLFLITVLSLSSPEKAFPENTAENPFSSVSGADTLKIGIRDAILSAMKNNPTVSIQFLEPDKAATYIGEEKETFDPVLSAGMTKSKSSTQKFLGTRPTPLQLISDKIQYDLGISQNLPTGTSVSLDAIMTSSLSSLYSDQYTGGLSFTVTQSLLQGLNPAANLASIRKARIDLEMSKFEMKAVAEQVISDVEKAYWKLSLASEEVSICFKSLELAEKLMDESNERVAVGKLPEIELASVRAELASRRGELIDAQSRNEQAKIEFMYLLNLNDGAGNPWIPNPVTSDTIFVPDDMLDDITVHEQLAVKFRPDLEQARLSLKKQEIELVRTKDGLLPKLDFYITVGNTTYSDKMKETYPDLGTNYYQVDGGLTFGMPFTNRKARAQVKREKINTEQTQIALKNMERLAKMDVRQAYIEIIRSREQIEASRATRILQEKNVEAETEKFRVGKSTNYLVLQAQRDFISSRLTEARSVVAYLDALVDLYRVEGTLLSRRSLGI